MTVGDSEIGAKYDIIINDRPIFDKFLRENEF